MKKSYVYANSQPLIQYDGNPKNPSAAIYFYLHDRLGSVRQVIDADGYVVNSYTYNPFGEDFATEVSEEIDNSFKFTGQFYDDEISQYYMRARQYDPAIGRFTTRDPVRGTFNDPMSLHPYLYCMNDPINRVDINGEIWGFFDMLWTSNLVTKMRVSTIAAYAYIMNQAQNLYYSAWTRVAGINRLISEILFGVRISLPNAHSMNHIFKASHNLGLLVEKFGSNANAYWVVWDKISQLGYSAQQLQSGVTINIAGINLWVTGSIVNGVVRISNFWAI